VVKNSLKELSMELVSMLELHIIVAVACMIGCGWTSYRIGHQEGIVTALDYLESEGVLSFDDE
tara:strand:+ start:528 stop:716 length:189 start_codon:yes stop_codon:yes gene_type:complete